VALIDEADSILIDDARTPLIIAASSPVDDATQALCRWARDVSADAVPRLLERDRDFIWEAGRRSAHLTEAGCRRVLGLPKPPLLAGMDLERVYRQVECALIAHHGMARDRDYLVVDGAVVIIDESTGRVMDGRKWQEGLHQAVEAKVSVKVTPSTRPAARITMQSFIKLYTHVAGLTGTAASARREFARVYGCPIAIIPTHRPCIRRALPPRVFLTWTAKVRAIVEEIERLVAWHGLRAHETHGQDGRATEDGHPRPPRRAVLVGTPSVEASELLSAELAAHGIEHQVLNCRHHAQEAAIIAAAGQAGRVTIATNMAGRGTDILISDEVRSTGGLHVILTELHTSARIDRQLIGRAARQGDPGSYQMFLSLEDSLLRTLPPRAIEALRRKAIAVRGDELPPTWLKLFRQAQRRLERTHLRQRRDLHRREKAQRETCERMGLDQCLEVAE
jgi:preprotein translocase subunit SecA